MARKLGLGCGAFITVLVLVSILIGVRISPATVTRLPTSAASATAAPSTPTAAPSPTERTRPTLLPASPTATAARGTPTSTVGYKLAVVQVGGYVAPSDPLVARMDAELADLTDKCGDTRERLSDDAIVIHDDLAKRGVTESELSILQHVAASIPNGARLATCDSVFAAYATLRLPR